MIIVLTQASHAATTIREREVRRLESKPLPPKLQQRALAAKLQKEQVRACKYHSFSDIIIIWSR